MKNLTLTCIQCQEDFEFTTFEQKKFNQRGFDTPLRCPVCRKNKSKATELEERKKSRDKKKLQRFKSDEYYGF